MDTLEPKKKTCKVPANLAARGCSREGTRRADLEVRNIRMAGKTDLLIDVTLRHPFIGAGRSGLTQGQQSPDQILESAAADKICNYRDPHLRNWQVAFLPA